MLAWPVSSYPSSCPSSFSCTRQLITVPARRIERVPSDVHCAGCKVHAHQQHFTAVVNVKYQNCDFGFGEPKMFTEFIQIVVGSVLCRYQGMVATLSVCCWNHDIIRKIILNLIMQMAQILTPTPWMKGG